MAFFLERFLHPLQQVSSTIVRVEPKVSRAVVTGSSSILGVVWIRRGVGVVGELAWGGDGIG